MNPVSKLGGAVHGSLGVCPGLSGDVAGLCTLWPGQWICLGSLGYFFYKSDMDQLCSIPPHCACAIHKH